MRLPDVRCECASPLLMSNGTHCSKCGFQVSADWHKRINEEEAKRERRKADLAEHNTES